MRETFEAVDGQLSIFDETVLTADSGFHTEESVEKLLENKIDAYVPDRKFRLRDPRYADLQEHKSKTVDRKRTSKARKYFTAEQFHFDSTGTLICPAGKPMKSSCPNWKSSNGYTGKTFRGFETECRACPVREKCLRNLATKVRQVTKIDKGTRNNTVSATQPRKPATAGTRSPTHKNFFHRQKTRTKPYSQLQIGSLRSYSPKSRFPKQGFPTGSTMN